MSRMQRLTALLVLAALLAGACTDSPGIEGDPSEGASESLASAPEAGQLRIELESVFGEQAHLIAEAGRAKGEARTAAAAALDEAGDELVDTVVEAAGADTIAERTLDRAGAAYLASLERDTSPAATTRIVGRLAEALAGVTDSLEPAAIEELVDAPVGKLADHRAAFAERDYEKAYELEREAYADMVTLGGAVAAGIIEDDPDRYPGPRSTGALELQSAFRQLLGEHALLVATTNRRGSAAAKDFEAAAAALNGNTADLGTAIGSVYDGATSFEAHWRDRISVLADYAAALGDDRTKTADRSEQQVKRLPDRIGDVLGRLSDDGIDEADSSAALADLDEAVLAQSRAFARKRYDEAEEAKAEAYVAGLALADVLAAAIAEHQPEAFPTE